MTHDFNEKLSFSRGVREQSDLATIKAILAGCTNIVKTNEEVDRLGIDYVATLRGGAEVLIDGKAREKGCSRFWKYGEPELALEKWSVRPHGKYRMPFARAKAGWTLSERSNVDMIYFSFDPSDSQEVFLIGFQSLRIAFRFYLTMWESEYRQDIQDSKRWESECLFVPVSVVQEAIKVTAQNVVRDYEGCPLFAPQT